MGSWIVRMVRTVTTDVFCEGCTREQAKNSPWEYAEDEMEIEQIDYEVTSVIENH